MAIKNKETGEYRKIVNFNIYSGLIIINCYANEQHRKNGDDEFLRYKQEELILSADLLKKALLNKTKDSIFDSLFKELYTLVKSEEIYKNWEDC